MPRSLAYTHRKTARQWHPTKNGDLTPRDVTAGSGKRVWWKCEEGPDHEWVASVGNRAMKGSGCPFCSGHRASVTNSLAALHPEIAAEWHPTKNGKLTPADVPEGSFKRVWWRCSRGPDHVWNAPVYQRARMGSGCSVCRGRTVAPSISLETLFPDITAEWHPTRNRGLTPADVVPGSNKRVWWRCPEGPDHEWQTSVNSRTGRGDGCPFCLGRRASVTNSLAALHPRLAKQWHPTRNGKLTAVDVPAGSGRRVWWKCPEGPDHEWEAQVYARVHSAGLCPFCIGQRVSVTNCLATVYPSLAAQWHRRKNGKLTPRDIVATSHKQFWWSCEAGRDHVWKASPKARVKSRGICPFCAGRRVSITNCLKTLFPKVAREWHPKRNRKLTPRQVLAASKMPVWWRCRRGHVWRATIHSRTVKGRGCPACAAGQAG